MNPGPLKIGTGALYGGGEGFPFFRKRSYDGVPTEEDLSHGCYAL